MIYAAILAGGSGTRFLDRPSAPDKPSADSEKPKQFLSVGNVPVIFRASAVFINMPEIDWVIIVVPESYIDFTKAMFADNPKATVIAGGENRNDSLQCALDFISNTCGIQPGDIITTHDAARPFVTESIIRENLAKAGKTGAAGVYITATDTVVLSEDGYVLTKNLPRTKCFLAQTPQTFDLRLLNQVLPQISSEEKSLATDVCGLFLARGLPVSMTAGDSKNIKITTAADMELANLYAQKYSIS